MRNYLALVPKYLAAHKKRTDLAIISVALSVALVTAIFSMLDVFLRFEKIQVIHDYGNYHLLIKDASAQEMQAIASRIDVEEAGRWIELGQASINGVRCAVGALDENLADNLNIKVIAGKYPAAKNEIMLEQWAVESHRLNVKINDTVRISSPGHVEREFKVSGIYNDLANMKAKAVPGVLMSLDGAAAIKPGAELSYIVLFKRGVKILNAEKEIKDTLKIADERIQRNERLLAVIGQSKHKAAVEIYTTGAILFLIVLIAGVMMIYNTFNISVMERVRQFGLLRCIGASRSQIRKLVEREGLAITLRAIPIGVIAGVIVTFILSAILKFYNDSIFARMPLFNISISGIIAGIATGFLTVFIASFLPARKAAMVSPINAVTGSGDIKISRSKKRGLLTKVFRVEIAMGINNAVMKKKTLFLMSCSIAISIILFLGFQVFVDFMHAGMKTTKPYTPDISLTSEYGISGNLYKKLSDIDGVKKAYGRRFAYVEAAFDAARLTEAYKKQVGNIEVKDNGLFVPPENSWLISYDRNQLNWAKRDLIDGTLDEDKLNARNGIIAVMTNVRKGVTINTVNLQLGDKVYIKTPAGTRELTVMGRLRSVPFNDSKLNLATFIATEKLFTELAGESPYQIIDIQLKKRNQEQTVKEIKGMLDSSITLHDARQKNAELDQAFLTMAVFVYGFVAVIALISILNIINTMNTSVASKTRYLGVMRAVGMSGAQMDKMVLAEAATYSLTGCLAGCVLGVMLQRALIADLLSSFRIVWRFPLAQIILIWILTLLVTALSVISPLKRIKARGISEVIGSL